MKNYFETELNYIKNVDIKEDLKEMIKIIPNYFYEVPASSTGKYHPLFSLGEGGLLRHTKFAVRIAYDLLNLEMYDEKFSPREKDLIIYSLVMHDAFKYGKVKEEYVRFDHPLIAADEILNNSKLEEREKIAKIISSHMGEWNKNKFSSIIMPKPVDEIQKFVHMCDYLSSKRYLNSTFEGNEIQEMERVC